MATRPLPAFSQREIVLAALLGSLIEFALLFGVVWAGNTTVEIRQEAEKEEELVPIEVMPVLDEVPLLKLGSKKDIAKPKLPDIWQKRAPVPVRRLEERSAPSEKAKDDPEEIPKSELADAKHKAPTEDDEIVKKANEMLDDDTEPEKLPELSEEGVEDGSEHGTETDPLKGRAVDLYRSKILGWFNARFRPPQGEIPCEELKKLSAGVAVHVGGDRTISSFQVTAPSGNGTFDAKVQSTLANLVGQQLPPPPPLYPDLLESVVYPRLSGAGVSCP